MTAQLADFRKPVATYPKLPYGAYANMPGIRASELKVLIQRTPAHLKVWRDAGNARDSDALRFGRAVHALVLEPERASKAVVRGPDCARRSAADKAAWVEAEDQAARFDGVVLRPEDYERAVACADAVKAHPGAARLCALDGEREFTVAWTERELKAKCRMDFANGYVLDLKTTRDASAEAFSRDLFKLGYHIQADWYMRGAHAAGLPAKGFRFIAVESAPPFAVKLHEVGPIGRNLAMSKIDTALEVLARCEALNQWPGYEAGVNVAEPPVWMWEKIEGEDD